MASGPRGNVKLIYCHGLESCKFSVPVCNVSVMETNVSDKCLVSAKLWIFWILVTKCLVNGDQYLEKSWQLSGVIPELFFIRNVTGEELGLRNGA